MQEFNEIKRMGCQKNISILEVKSYYICIDHISINMRKVKRDLTHQQLQFHWLAPAIIH